MTWFRSGLRSVTSMRVTRPSKRAHSTGSSSLRSDGRNWKRRGPMMTAEKGDRIKMLTTHYIDGTFVESHGREVMDILRPTDGRIIGRVTLADEEDTRRAVAAARRAFATYSQSATEERAKLLRRLHEAATRRIDELT